MTGSIPDFNPLNSIYNILYNQDLPDYLDYGFYSIGLFSLFYSLVVILLLAPISCATSKQINTIDLDKPSLEDILIYLPLVYVVYILVLYRYDLLTTSTALVGFIVIMLPMAYRMLVYWLNSIAPYKNSCYYSLYLFILSFALAIPVTVFFIILIHNITSIV